MKLEKCSYCGLCKSYCPVFKALLEETKGARGKAGLVRKEIMDEVFYECSLCGACKISCPAGIDLPKEIENMRQKMVEAKVETKANIVMIKNLREHGNPYGKIEKGKIPKGLYCC